MITRKLNIGQKMFLGFGIVILIMLTVISNSYINFVKESEAVKWNVHTYQVIQESDDVLMSLINMETGARGYVITGNESFFEPFNQGMASYEKHFGKLKELTADNPGQQLRLIDLNKQYKDWLNWEETKIIIGRQKVSSGEADIQDLIAVVQAGEGKAMMDNMRSILGEINEDEERILESKNAELIKMEKETRAVMLLGGVLATIAAIIIAILVIRMITRPVKVVTTTFKEIAEGDVNLEVRLNDSSNDELGRMARHFNVFMTKLKELILENKNQSWITSGRAELNEEMREEQDIAALSSKVIAYICKYLNVQIGALYIKNDSDTYKMMGSYAYNTHKNLSDEIKLGEGIIGQSALEKQINLITNIPKDYIKIASGIGEAAPKNILVVPCMYHNEVECIIELGSFDEITEVQLKFVHQISETIAISINLTKAQIRMKELLDKTLVQSEELQVQQEELRQNNEELEEQAKVLIKSEMNLQAQQEELRVSNEELEEKTRRLEKQKKDIVSSNERLSKAKAEIEEKARELETANKYKSEFLANMSHELRTPLNSILVLSQLLENKKDNAPLTDKQLEYARTIHSSGENLLRLINDILDLSKVEAGKMDINLEKVNLEELAEDVKRLFMPIASKDNLEFKVQIEEGLPETIVSDSLRLQQIVNNLLSNAFKFTHNGGVTMNICRTKESDADLFGIKGNIDKLINIEIIDTGIGISPEKQKLIFEAFKQSDGTTSRKYGGTGLGLSISKELAYLLGGTIYVKSQEEKGSNFTLVVSDKADEGRELTSLTEEKNIVKNEPVKYSIEGTEISENRSETNKINEEEIIREDEKLLLIIEDDEQFIKVLSELADKKGYKVLAGRNGEEGLKLAEKYKPDAILLDIGLPDINGWKVVDKLKAMEDTMDIPIHIISGRQDIESNKKLQNLVGYLKKPVNLEDLYSLFNNLENAIAKDFKKLLIVDENRDQTKIIYDSLSKKGFQVTTLESGLDAYNLLKKEQFDCMILDLKLKDMNGLELLNKLKDEESINFPILIHTEKNITQEDEAELNKYVESIIIKGNHSIERLIDEASLFFYNVDSKLENKKIKHIKSNHEKENSLINKKILIVDDDMRNVFSLTSALEEKGIRVIVGRNGAEGIQRLHENSDVDLILMDVMMPEMDGYTAMKKIKKENQFKNIPIIAITAKAMKDDRQKCIEAGANDYLTKPIEINKLISLLRVWLYK